MQLLVLLLSILVFLLISVALCWYRYSTMVQVRPAPAPQLPSRTPNPPRPLAAADRALPTGQRAMAKQKDPKVTKSAHFALGSESTRARVLALERTISRLGTGAGGRKAKQR